MKTSDPMYMIHNRTDISGAFSDPRLFLVPQNDRRIAGVSDSPARVEQLPDGPTYLAIGEHATDVHLQRIVEMYPMIPLADLVAFRESMRGAS